MNRHIRGVICTLSGAVMWGFSGACGQYLFNNYQVNSSWVTAVRMLGAGAALMCMCLVKEREKCIGIWRNRRDAIQLAAFAILGLLFCQYAYLTAIAYSNAGTATVLQYLGPVLIMGVVCVRERRFPDKKETIAVILAVLGTWLLATHGNPSAMVLSKQGLIWGLIAAVSLASYTLLPVKLIPKWGSMVVCGYGMLIGGMVLSAGIGIWRMPVELDMRGWLAVGGVVVMGTILGYTLYLQGIADIGAVKASMMASVEPVSATLFSVLWLHTDFQSIDLAGFICIMTTVFLLAKKQESNTPQQEKSGRREEMP